MRAMSVHLARYFTSLVHRLDEDDYARMLERGGKECPYWRDGDEYKVVRHQM